MNVLLCHVMSPCSVADARGTRFLNARRPNLSAPLKDYRAAFTLRKRSSSSSLTRQLPIFVMSFVLCPRLHLAEIEDQTWCPSWLREHSHSALARMWRTETTSGGSPAIQACGILLKLLGGPSGASKFTFVDSCAGAGGPTPLIEETMNSRLESAGFPRVRFYLTDLWPDTKAWKSITDKSPNITAVPDPVDATQAKRLAPAGRKECRIFNLCFHHFKDAQARKVLKSAVESTDAFV